MSHQHQTKKTHLKFIEFDDVDFSKIEKDIKYLGEGNSMNRVLEYDFEYCLECGYRMLNGEPIMTKGILEYEFERYVSMAKRGNYVGAEELTVQHSEFDSLQNVIRNAVAFGKLREKKSTQQ